MQFNLRKIQNAFVFNCFYLVCFTLIPCGDKNSKRDNVKIEKNVSLSSYQLAHCTKILKHCSPAPHCGEKSPEGFISSLRHVIFLYNRLLTFIHFRDTF